MIYTEKIRSRFWAKVDKSPGLGPKGLCWEWRASFKFEEYGQFTLMRRPRFAHIVSYEMNVEPVPPGLCVCHHCDNQKCIRPDHLFLGTKADNNRDMREKGRGGHGLRQTLLTKRTFREIVATYAWNISQHRASGIVGVSQTHISRILRGVVHLP